MLDNNKQEANMSMYRPPTYSIDYLMNHSLK